MDSNALGGHVYCLQDVVMFMNLPPSQCASANIERCCHVYESSSFSVC